MTPRPGRLRVVATSPEGVGADHHRRPQSAAGFFGRPAAWRSSGRTAAFQTASFVAAPPGSGAYKLSPPTN